MLIMRVGQVCESKSNNSRICDEISILVDGSMSKKENSDEKA